MLQEEYEQLDTAWYKIAAATMHIIALMLTWLVHKTYKSQVYVSYAFAMMALAANLALLFRQVSEDTALYDDYYSVAQNQAYVLTMSLVSNSICSAMTLLLNHLCGLRYERLVAEC